MKTCKKCHTEIKGPVVSNHTLGDEGDYHVDCFQHRHDENQQN